jgi:hypothetical protein
MDEWQRFALDIFLAENPESGLWEAFECCLIVARQNGKGSILECLELGWLFLLDEQIAHTAQLMSTARDAYGRLLGLIRAAPHLSVLVPPALVKRSADDFSISTLRGGRIEFGPRSGRQGRGTGKDKVVYDEAMFLDPEEIAAQVPTMSTCDNPQLLYTSSAGRVGSQQLRSLRRKGRAGGDAAEGLAYLEWSAEVPEDGTDPDYDDQRLWRQANPSLGKRISYHYIRGERRAMADMPKQFGRERLSIFDEPTTAGRVITSGQWDALVNLGAVAAGAAVFALTVSAERDAAAITVAGWQTSGVPVVEIVTTGPAGGLVVDPDADPDGVDVDEQLRGEVLADEPAMPAGLAWVVEWFAERPGARVAVQQGAPAGALVGRLQAAGADVVPMATGRVARASQAFYDAVNGAQLAHLGDELMEAAVSAGRRRDIGDGGWLWSQRDSAGDIGPLVGASMALDELTSGSAERVYPVPPAALVGDLPAGLDEPDTDPGWPRVWAYGVGLRRPLVWQCWVVDPDGVLWLQHEIYRAPVRRVDGRLLPIDPAEVGREISALGLPAPRTVLSESPRADRRAFEQALGVVARAPAGDLSEGIAAMQARVARDQLRVASGTVVSIDQSLRAAARPTSLVDELAGYVWPVDDRDGEVRPCGDAYALDAARWVTAHTDLRGRAVLRFL